MAKSEVMQQINDVIDEFQTGIVDLKDGGNKYGQVVFTFNPNEIWVLEAMLVKAMEIKSQLLDAEIKYYNEAISEFKKVS